MLVLVLLPRGADAGAAARKQEAGGLSVRELATSPVFHALFWSFVICGFITAGVIETHFIPTPCSAGSRRSPAPTAYSLLMAVNFGGVVLAGWLSDRMHRPLLLGSIYILRGLAFLLLMNITGDPAMLAAFAVMFGLFDYSTVPVTASIMPAISASRSWARPWACSPRDMRWAGRPGRSWPGGCSTSSRAMTGSG